MLSLFGFLLFFNTVGTVIGQLNPHFVLGNSAYNISFTTINTSIDLERNETFIVTLFFDQSSNACFPSQLKKDMYNSYCSEVGNEKTYVLELLNTTDHDDLVFTGDQKICVIVEPDRIDVDMSRVDQSYQVEIVAFNTKPEPSFVIQITVKGSMKEVFVKNTTKCNNTLTDYHVLHTFDSTTLEGMFPELKPGVPFDLSAYIFYIGLDGIRSSANSTTYVYMSEGTTTPDTTLETSTDASKCKECCHHNLIVLNITVALIVLVIIVVIIIVVIHFCKIEEKKCAYWATHIFLIFGGLGCVILAIVQIRYLAESVPIPSDPECCRCHYNPIVLIIKAALIALVIILDIINFIKRQAKKCGIVYWALNICLIFGGLGCVILAIVQTVYLAKGSDDCCHDTGFGVAIAFVVLAFSKPGSSIFVLILRLKNRDQKEESSDTEMKLGSENMKPGSEKEKNGTSDRPLPEPKRT